ncbi:alanine dehydrogenase/PNT domain-containing protein [Phlyctema vagabunda]|uniref:Saccharopine dehydrogenase [NAD(+), L-lysine-forming] n=1 Tax=Phlyctema vagabunda TaxID=108571 RepID=A0ABR4PJB1_9HELO
MNMSGTILHLRSELGKALEHRSALTPTTTKALIEAGYTVNVERSPERIFDDEEFEKAGATLVPENTWREAPKDHIIIGLKELPVEEFPLEHVHVQFAHCYKQQGGWEKVLSRFPRGGGTLLDLEFLVDENKRRVAAFGYHAGFAGAALALETWAWQLTHSASEPFPSVESYPNEDELIVDVKKAIEAGTEKNGRTPRVLVIGALGRCGSGAVDLCLRAGVPTENILKWDMAETAKGGPFPEIVESDIFVNCIYLMSKIPNFVDMNSLDTPSRNLSVICDVSADTTNPNNPIPVYTVATTFTEPTVPVEVKGDPRLSVISIDHLPSLLPREASEAFSNDLLSSLLHLNEWRTYPVFSRAEKLFQEKVATLPKNIS